MPLWAGTGLDIYQEYFLGTHSQRATDSRTHPLAGRGKWKGQFVLAKRPGSEFNG